MVTETTEEDIIEAWDYPVELEPDKNLYRLLSVIIEENQRIDLDIETIYDNRFVQSATGKELEKWGDLVGVTRKTGEKDSKLRVRIIGAFIAQASDTTFDSFASSVMAILDTTASSIGLTTPPDSSGPKTVDVEVDGAVLEDSPLTTSELQVLFNEALSIDGKANISSTGTFAFEGDDSSLEGWDEGTWSSSI